MKKFLLFFIIILLTNSSFPQFTEFHPELDWYTIKGEHVEVHYHNGAERTAKVVAKIADEVWGPITSLYQYEPDKVHYVIKDIDDYSNGATYFFDNKIEIWTSALDFDLRGTHNWLRNVISHEFTHMVQLQAAMKLNRSVPAVFLQLLNYQEERRPDILYGYPNYVVSYPIATVNVPAWFAEGTAQYMRKEFNYDNWDSHRDMILRSYALDDNMLTWNQMGVFGKTSLGNESVYNSGFALTRYISQKYGEDKLRTITEKLGSFGNFTIDAAFEDVLGKNGDEIYTEWQTFLKEDYGKRIEKVKANLVDGEMIAKAGFGNFYPTFSKDGKKIYYISNKSSDYFVPSGIYEYDIESKKDKQIVSGVRSTFSWIPGENKILYSKITEDNPNWYNVHDIFVYDIDEEDETRLTENLRADQPSVSHDGSKIVFLFQKDGTTNLGIVNIEGSGFQQLTSFENGEQVYNPKFSNDDSFIILDYSYHETRDIAKVDVNGGEVEFVIQTENDERNPTFDKNGNLIYASDETGIFNIYSLNLLTGKKQQLTNVVGGAFMPEVNGESDLTYSGYTSTGYKIFLVEDYGQGNVESGKSYVQRENPPLDMSKPNGDINQFDVASLKNFNDFFIDRNYGTIVGQNGTILRTTDGGTVWNNQTSGTSFDLYGVTFNEKENGAAIGENGTILVTTNGGIDWIKAESGTTMDIWGISLIDSNYITVVGEGGTILRSENGGKVWIDQQSSVTTLLRSVSFVDYMNGIVVGENGIILKTTDGGENWNKQASGISSHLWGIDYIDSNAVTIVGEGGIILRTTNRGKSWLNQSSGTSNHLWNVSFTDTENGIIVGENGLILLTNDGGRTWRQTYSGSENHLLGVSFSDLQNAMAVGVNGNIFRTTDSGKSWFNQTSTTVYDLYDVSKTPESVVTEYSGAFSSLTFFPFIRFDNYNTANSFWQKIKPGVYVASNDMLNRYSIFAGAALNIRLERDLFFIFEYKNKLPLISLLGLHPELAAELYSTSRKSDVDILFGPDTVNGNVNYDQIIPTEVTYNLLEFDLVARHRIFNRFNNLEFRFIFSRYTATLSSFIIETDGDPILYPTSDDTYFIGRNFRLSYNFAAIAPTRDSDINPVGAEVDFVYDYEWNEFNDEGEYEIEDGLLKPKYNDYNFHRLLFDGSMYFPLWSDHTLTTRLVGGTILGPQVPDFFDFYLGGLIGFKAYPFYSLSGNEIAWINLTYRFPLWRNIDYQLGSLYFDKIFLSFHFDYGNAWNGEFPELNDFKKGAGAEIRMHMNSYYLFPTAFFFNASYGFDQFDKVVDRGVATYGQEWRFYGGILFGFDIVNSKTSFTNPNGIR